MTDDDQRAIRVDQYLQHPPAKVWRALTEPELMARWLMPNDFKLEVGHRFTMEGVPIKQTDFDGTVLCEVLEIEPLRKLKISWGDRRGTDWTVTWRLEAEGRGTRLFLDHEGFDPADPVEQLSRKIMGGGWRSMVLSNLEKVLADLS